MKISYIFPITDNSINIKDFYKNFCLGTVYKSYDKCEVFFVVPKDFEIAVKDVNALAIKNEDVKLLTTQTTFAYGEAFKLCLPHITGDVTLLGDVFVDNNEIFEKMLKRHKEGANIVHVKKRSSRAKEFFKKIFEGIYNFFIVLFTGKSDKINIPSLQLLDKTVIDILKELPEKANYLRNCKYLEGLNARTIYLDSQIKTYKNNFKQKTDSIITFAILTALFILCLTSIVLVNILVASNTLLINLVLIILTVVLFVFSIFALAKHILDVRICNSKKDIAICGKANLKG